jgi:hypothetical protein
MDPIVAAGLAAMLTSTCGTRVPEPEGIPPGTPHVSWVFMSGTRENPDQDFVCQSDPRDECAVPASRPDAPVFVDVHFYCHGAGAETRYLGTIHSPFTSSSSNHRRMPLRQFSLC